MQLSETTATDVIYMAEHTISRDASKALPSHNEYSYTLWHEGTILGMGGFITIAEGTAWGWIDITDTAKKHMIQAYRILGESLEKMAEKHKITRLQSYVEVDFQAGIRTVEHLGFKVESRMKKFINGKDAFLFVRFF